MTSVGVSFDARPPQGETAPSGGSAVHEVTNVGGHYLAVGITNSAPFGVLSGQRCMIDFWRV